MKGSFNRRMVTRARRTLNGLVDWLHRLDRASVGGVDAVQSVENAVRLLNTVAYQYYLIPNEIREKYFREELSDGVRLCDVEEG